MTPPAKHKLVPETVYPGLHVGWQVDPPARVEVQLPTAPLVGAAGASHTYGVQQTVQPERAMGSSLAVQLKVEPANTRMLAIRVGVRGGYAW